MLNLVLEWRRQPMSLTQSLRDAKLGLSSDPAKAKVAFAAHNELVGATEVSVKVGSGHRFIVDEPPALGGADKAANPVEYTLASLGSCQAITYRVWAAELGVKLDRVEIDIGGDLDLRGFLGLDDRVRAGFSAVRARVRLAGPESDARYQELADAVDAHCPVLDLFRNPVPVDRSIAVSAQA
jgi:uncharacterized OsmC-like protein